MVFPAGRMSDLWLGNSVMAIVQALALIEGLEVHGPDPAAQVWFTHPEWPLWTAIFMSNLDHWLKERHYDCKFFWDWQPVGALPVASLIVPFERIELVAREIRAFALAMRAEEN